VQASSVSVTSSERWSAVPNRRGGALSRSVLPSGALPYWKPPAAGRGAGSRRGTRSSPRQAVGAGLPGSGVNGLRSLAQAQERRTREGLGPLLLQDLVEVRLDAGVADAVLDNCAHDVASMSGQAHHERAESASVVETSASQPPQRQAAISACRAACAGAVLLT
jgi:hypothetical protein